MVAGRHRQRQTVRFSGLFTGTSPPLDEQPDKMVVGCEAIPAQTGGDPPTPLMGVLWCWPG